MDYKTMMEIETEKRKFEIEELILGMADLVYENRKLRYELAEAKHWEEEYTKLLARTTENNMKDTQFLFKLAINSSLDRIDKIKDMENNYENL